MSGKPPFLAELTRRNVLRAGLLYAGAVWALAQGIAQLGPSIGLPDWTTRWFLVAAIIGFPFWLAFAWFYEFTPQGLKRESEIDPADSLAHSTGRKLNYWITGVLAVAVVLLLTDRLMVSRDATNASIARTLHDPGAPQAVIPAKSIAVLPFADMSTNHDQAYFSDGMAEELLNALAQVRDMKVAGRTSSFYFKDHTADLRTIAKALGVANILQGSVRKQGDQVRITAQLVRAADDTQLWSHAYDGDLGDVFKLQESIARAITTELKVVLVGEQKTHLAPPPTQSVQAHQQYLLGQYFWHQRGYANLHKALVAFKAALDADPDYADAWAGLAQTYALLPEYYDTDPANTGPIPDTVPLAMDAVEHALRLRPDMSSALLARAYIRGVRQFDWKESAQDFRTALTSSPHDATAHQWYGEILAYQKRWPEAYAQLDAAMQIDPLSPIMYHLKGYWLASQGQYAAALPDFNEALRITPGLFFPTMWKMLSLTELRRFDEAIAVANTLSPSIRESVLRFIAAKRDPALDNATAKYILANAPNTQLTTPVMLLQLGKNDLALSAVERMFQQHAPFRAYINALGQFDPLRADPRFQALLRQVKLAPPSAGAAGQHP